MATEAMHIANPKRVTIPTCGLVNSIC